LCWLFESVPKLNTACEYCCSKITGVTDRLLVNLIDKTTIEIAEYCRNIYTLKCRAEAKGDLYGIARYSYEQKRIRETLQRNNITNVTLTGKIVRESK
jgi:hypothetical protein